MCKCLSVSRRCLFYRLICKQNKWSYHLRSTIKNELCQGTIWQAVCFAATVFVCATHVPIYMHVQGRPIMCTSCAHHVHDVHKQGWTICAGLAHLRGMHVQGWPVMCIVCMSCAHAYAGLAYTSSRLWGEVHIATHLLASSSLWTVEGRGNMKRGTVLSMNVGE